MTDLSRLRLCLDRAVRALAEASAMLAAIDHGAADLPAADRLRIALGDETEGDWFTTGQLWRLAQSQAAAAAVTGADETELSAALRAAGINNPHALGRWLASREGDGIERAGRERDGTLWRVFLEPPKARENTPPIQRHGCGS